MLRVMKTFIFAAIYADQEANIAEEFLILKRHSSTVSEKEKPTKPKPKKDLDEAQF
jgi:hypothetical protein